MSIDCEKLTKLDNSTSKVLSLLKFINFKQPGIIFNEV